MFVSAKTGEQNKLVILLEFEVEIKLPPKYLNKSREAKGLNFNQLAPFDINVKIIFNRYNPLLTQTDTTYDLKIVDIAIASNA